MMLHQRQPRKTDPRFLAWIRTLPCLLCGDNTTVEAAHVRMSEPRLGKRQTGKGEKPDDRWVLPLCHAHHDMQHLKGEKIFWLVHDVNPLAASLVLRLAYEREDREGAERFIETIINFATGTQQ
jgi:hypothetical protein